MTEIRIDNRPVAIGDTTFELVAYNPLADETADHTYDIDIDLAIPANAAALGHIGRLDRDLAAAWGEYRSGEVHRGRRGGRRECVRPGLGKDRHTAGPP